MQGETPCWELRVSEKTPKDEDTGIFLLKIERIGSCQSKTRLLNLLESDFSIPFFTPPAENYLKEHFSPAGKVF